MIKWLRWKINNNNCLFLFKNINKVENWARKGVNQYQNYLLKSKKTAKRAKQKAKIFPPSSEEICTTV